MIVWMLYGEIFHPDSKDVSASAATIFNNSSKAIIVFTFPFSALSLEWHCLSQFILSLLQLDLRLFVTFL